MPENITEKHVAVVGGGIAGLTAALRLSERGYKVTVLEEKPYLGGMLGAHHGDPIFTMSSDIEEICEQLDEGKFPNVLRTNFSEHNRKLPEPIDVSVIIENWKWRVSGEHQDLDTSYVISRPTRYESIEAQCNQWMPETLPPDAVPKALNYLNVYNGAFYEHCFHMYLNWYNNFWQIVEDDLGVNRDDLFSPRTNVKFLDRGDFPQTHQLTNVGAPETMLENLMSNVASPHDMYLYGYSLVDLLATPFHRSEFLNKYTVNGFMRARWYATNESAELHQDTLAKAFAVPSYLTSANSYKNFIKFGTVAPDPMLWIMNGNSQKHLIDPIEAKLRERGCTIMRGVRVEKALMNDERAIEKIRWTYSAFQPEYPISRHQRPMWDMPVDFVVFAVPRVPLARLIEERDDGDRRVISFIPQLDGIRQLRDEPMASLDIYFTKKLKDIPKENVILRDCRYELTFIDNSQSWTLEPEIGDRTVLNVVVSSFHSLPGYYQWDEYHIHDIAHDVIKNLSDYVFGFDPGSKWGESPDIDWDLTNLNLNLDQRMLINEVGSYDARPKTSYDELPNLFFAGDLVRNIIDVVTIEGAVITGLAAAQAVHRAYPLGDPIEIIQPEVYPESAMVALRALGFPGALVARWFSIVDDVLFTYTTDLTPEEIAHSEAELLYAPYKMASDMWESAWSTYMGMFGGYR